jgi:hypothetical protein
MALLTSEEMVQLTGRRKPSKQIAWLKDKGLRENVHFFVNAAGYPQVLDTLLPIKHLRDFELGEVR